MDSFIERHYESPEVFQSRVLESEDEREKAIPLLEMKSSLAGPVLSTVRVAALTHLAVDPRAGSLHTWEAWLAYAEVAESLFAVSEAPVNETIERKIGKKVRSLTGVGVSGFSDAGNWLEAYFLARTCRDEEKLEFLSRIPVDTIRSAQVESGFDYDEYVYSWISALQDYTLDRSTLSRNLLRALELSDPRENPDTDSGYLNKIILPQINALLRAAELNTEEFNQGLDKGLRSFRSYYTESPERAKDLNGVLPLGLFAISCMAFDLGNEHAGFNPEFNTDYLPDHILMRIWERYFLM